MNTRKLVKVVGQGAVAPRLRELARELEDEYQNGALVAIRLDRTPGLADVIEAEVDESKRKLTYDRLQGLVFEACARLRERGEIPYGILLSRDAMRAASSRYTLNYLPKTPWGLKVMGEAENGPFQIVVKEPQ